MNNILVVNVNWMGDVIFSLPVLKALKKSYPGAKVCVLAVPRIRDILEMNPNVDDVIIYDERGRHRLPWDKCRLIGDLKRRHFDAAFLLHRSLTRALLVFLAGIPQRIGYDVKGRGALLTHKTALLKKGAHRSDHYLNVVESFGIKADDRDCELVVFDDDRRKVVKLLTEYGIAENDFLVVVNAGGNWDLKRWPKENFARLIRQLIDKYNAKVVISGADNDIGLTEEIASASGGGPAVLAGRTGLKPLAALMQRADLVISADTGPMHLASSVGSRVIAIFGPTRPEVTGPRGTGKTTILQKDVGCNRKPCYNLACPDNVCMPAVTVEDVLKAVEEVMGQGSGKRE